MTGAETLDAAIARRPIFRGPLDDQRPAIVRRIGGDPWLALAVAALVGLGLVMVFDVSWFPGGDQHGDPLLFVRKQVLAVGLGLVVCLGASRVPTVRWRALAYPCFALTILALVLVLVPGVGVVRNGAQRWIGLGPLGFQPTEIAKPAFVLFLAALLARKGERVRELGRGIAPAVAVTLVVTSLALAEPDYGTAALCSLILVAMLFVAGARLVHLGILAAGGFCALLALAVTSPYRMQRILAFLDCSAAPLDEGFQLCQSLLAFGSGGVTGVGLGQGQQKLKYLPAAHTDFIFSVIGEELGIFGIVIVLGLFLVIAVRGFRLAIRHQDDFASLLAFGLTLLLVIQALLNMSVTMGLVPTKGLPLPFVSYGGSAMLISLAQVGVLLAVAREAG